MNILGVDVTLDNLPDDLLELVVGEKWPDGDENAMRQLASEWTSAASELEQIAADATRAARGVQQHLRGANGDAFQSFWTSNFDDGQATSALPFSVKFCRSMATALDNGATQIEMTKDSIMGNIALLAVTVTPQIAAAVADFGTTLATATAEILAERVAMEGLLRAAAELMARIVTDALLQGLEQALGQTAISFTIQLKEVAEGHLAGINYGDVGKAALSGFEGGAVGGVIGTGTGALGGAVLGDGIAGSVVGKAAIGIAAGGITNATMDVAETGHLSASDFGKGSLAGAVGAAADEAHGSENTAAALDDGHPAVPGLTSMPALPDISTDAGSSAEAAQSERAPRESQADWLNRMLNGTPAPAADAHAELASSASAPAPAPARPDAGQPTPAAPPSSRAEQLSRMLNHGGPPLAPDPGPAGSDSGAASAPAHADPSAAAPAAPHPDDARLAGDGVGAGHAAPADPGADLSPGHVDGAGHDSGLHAGDHDGGVSPDAPVTDPRADTGTPGDDRPGRDQAGTPAAHAGLSDHGFDPPSRDPEAPVDSAPTHSAPAEPGPAHDAPAADRPEPAAPRADSPAPAARPGGDPHPGEAAPSHPGQDGSEPAGPRPDDGAAGPRSDAPAWSAPDSGHDPAGQGQQEHPTPYEMYRRIHGEEPRGTRQDLIAMLVHGEDPAAPAPGPGAAGRGATGPARPGETSSLPDHLADISANAEVDEHGVSLLPDPAMRDMQNFVPPDPHGAFDMNLHGNADGVWAHGRNLTAQDLLDLANAHGHQDGQTIRLTSCDAGARDDGIAAELARISGCKVIAADSLVWTDSVGHMFASGSHRDYDRYDVPDIPPTGHWHEFSPDGTKVRLDENGFPPGQETGFDRWGAPVGDTASRGAPRDDAVPGHPGADLRTEDARLADVRPGDHVSDTSKPDGQATDSLQSDADRHQPEAGTPKLDAPHPDEAASNMEVHGSSASGDIGSRNGPERGDRPATNAGEHRAESGTSREPEKTGPPEPRDHSGRPTTAAHHQEPVQHTGQLTGQSHHAGDGPAAAPQDHTGHVLTHEPAPASETRKDQSDESDTNKGAQTFLLLCTEYSAKRGGVVVFNRALAEGLADAGQDVVVRIGEDASPYADLERPNLHILGPKDLPPPTTGPDGKKVEPNPRDFLGPEHDPKGMPEHVDYVVGHTRFSGPDAKAERDAHYTDAKLIHFVHMVPEALGRVKENGDPSEPGEAAKGVENHNVERGLVADADLAAGVGPAITDNVREMLHQARDLEAQGGKPVKTQAVHELIPGMEFRERGERATEGRPLKVLLFGRVDVGQKGGRAAAAVVGRLRAEGHPVELIVRGVPANELAPQRRVLREIMDDSDVEVRPFTVERSDLHADLDDADVMIMTSRAEGFGLTAQEAAAAGVPVVVPSSSGFGRWLGESGQFSEELTGPSIVEQGFEDQVPIDAWTDALRNVIEDYPAAQQRALDLQQEFKDRQVTWANATESLIKEAKRLQ